ncbi:MAG TPA: hypothetical protein VGF32_28860 [Streptosporangiaceae bacterium]|jgi:hypothetical protein
MLREFVSAARRRAAATATAGVSAFALIVPLGAVGPAVHPVPSHAAPAPVRAHEVGPPSDTRLPQATGLYTTWCTGRGACLGGGNYADASGSVQPMVAAQAGGRWQHGTRLVLPANAGEQPYAQVNGVACRSAGNCVAVGNYTYDPQHNVGAFIASEASGGWAPAFTPQLPADAVSPPRARLAAVTCRPDGFCAAVGSYQAKTGQIQAMVVTKPAGQAWGRATEITPPASAIASPDAALTGIDCTGPGSCVAVGHYNDGPSATRGMGVVETGGSWGRATGIPAPRGSVASSFTGFSSVSCRPYGECLAVGVFAVDGTRDSAMSVTEFNGSFGTAAAITAVPAGAAARPSTALSGIACPRRGPCVAAGVATNAAGHYVAMYATRSHGRWAADFLTGPANVSVGKDEQSSLFSVSCGSRDFCTAVGYYNDTTGGYGAAAISTR